VANIQTVISYFLYCITGSLAIKNAKGFTIATQLLLYDWPVWGYQNYGII